MTTMESIRLDLLTLDQAAEALHITLPTLRKLIRAGHLATFQHPGVARVYVTPDAIAAYVARCTETGEAQAAALRAQGENGQAWSEPEGSVELRRVMAGLPARGR